MNDYEELLDRAAACLKDASKIEDPGVRANVLALVYHSQKVAQAEIFARPMSFGLIQSHWPKSAGSRTAIHCRVGIFKASQRLPIQDPEFAV
jgi:hypothetical protein